MVFFSVELLSCDIEVELRLFGLTVNGEHLIMKQGLHKGDVKLLFDP